VPAPSFAPAPAAARQPVPAPSFAPAASDARQPVPAPWIAPAASATYQPVRPVGQPIDARPCRVLPDGCRLALVDATSAGSGTAGSFSRIALGFADPDVAAHALAALGGR
jgi:hypothetical protein